MPKISVIIPTYNNALTLGQAIDSALEQTYRDVEVIVIDDGSSDQTGLVVQRYGSSIRYIRQTNSGLPAARNRGIELATGEFIALLDADDWWEPNKLAEQLPRFSDPKVGLVYTDLRVVYENGDILESFLASRPLAGDGYVFDRLLESGFILPSTVVLRRTSLEQVGMFDESMRSHEDIELWLRLTKLWKVSLVRMPMTHRRQGSGNMTANPFLGAEYGVRLFEKVVNHDDLTPDQRARATRKLSDMLLGRAYFYFTEGQPGRARKDLIRSLGYDLFKFKAYPYLLATFLPARAISAIRRLKSSARTTGASSSTS